MIQPGDEHAGIARWRAFSLAEAAILGAVLAAVGIEYGRHAWPFATRVHPHETGATAEPMDPAMPMAPMPEDHTSHAVPGRTAVTIDAQHTELIGVTVTHAEVRWIGDPLRLTATIAPDEARVSHVHTRVAGWIERLYVNTTGQRVRAGEPLAAIFSQELLASQAEYLAARRSAAQMDTALAGAEATLVESARARLRVLGMTDGEVASIDRSNQPLRDVVVVAPRTGTVLHRGITAGTSVDPSTELLTVADLSTVWVFVEMPETDIPLVPVGTNVTLVFPAAAVAGLVRPVEFLYPTLSEQTRTLRGRLSVPNPDGRLRPGEYGTAEIDVAPRRALTIPRDAIVDTGDEQHVFVVTGNGHYEPRRVTLGAHLEDRVEVREGVGEAEQIVASGVFLLDSESRLRASGAPAAGHHAGHGG